MIACCMIYGMFLLLAGVCQLQASQVPPADNQPRVYAEKHPDPPSIVTDSGNPVDSVVAMLSCGKYGPAVLYDNVFVEQMVRFNRERIPERVVHSKGTGAFGYFEVTHDITKYTKAIPFEKVGKRTPISVRFSTALGDLGSADTARDNRGYAIKFCTEQGSWDLIGISLPVFFFRDPSLIVGFVHSAKRNPQTNILNYNNFWDFITGRPETVHAMLFFLGDRGIPDGFRQMDGFAIHSFKLVNDKNEIFYARFTWKTDQGMNYLSSEKAANISGMDPDYFTRDLYNAIENKEFPSWTLYLQVVPAEEATKYRFNIFDATKVLLHEDYPLMPVGKIVLNQNPSNHFAEVEQMALCPANFVPGVEPSVYDKLLQARIFAYADTQRYRLGTNYLQLPVNLPRCGMPVENYNRDGTSTFYNKDGQPSHYPNIYNGPQPVPSAAQVPEGNITCTVKRYDLGDEDNYTQPRIFWEKVINQDEKDRIVQNIVNLAKSTERVIKVRIVHYFKKVSEELGERLLKEFKLDLTDLKSE